MLVRVPEYRQSLSLIKPPPGEEATPFTNFFKARITHICDSARRHSSYFKQQTVANIEGNNWGWIGGISLGSEGPPTLIVANGHEVRSTAGASFPFPGGPVANALFQMEFCP